MERAFQASEWHLRKVDTEFAEMMHTLVHGTLAEEGAREICTQLEIIQLVAQHERRKAQVAYIRLAVLLAMTR